ncbi:DUF3304 domain-containing protein [Pseudomonas abietaniphila]|uniref:DUF3304 domain-containing protein n=1 Tax=Pseudomonas abietaniphila TaxID=89065 RepID=UPI0009E355EB|nr:DUF3304 domain-containing protein [Pseudomonas abietaniphila]
MKRLSLGTFLGMAVLLIAASRYEKPPPEPPPKPRYFGTAVSPMDHERSDTFVRPVYVNGGGVGAASTGGSTTYGALGLPAIWHPGLTVRVKWRRCQPYGKNCRWIEKDVLVHPYDHSGGTNLHILENDDVLIIPTMLAPNNPDYPGPGYPEKNFYARKGISK